MKLIFVRDSKNRGYAVLGIDSGEGARAYTVPVSFYASIGAPLCGDIISDDAFSEVLRHDEMFRATKKALSLLAYADNNTKTLKMKLRRAGFSAEASERAVEEMMRGGYINERRQLERIVISEVENKLVGRGLLIPKLIAKGYKRTDVEEVIDALVDSGEIDFGEIKRILILKKLGADPDPEAVHRLLYKNGFSCSD